MQLRRTLHYSKPIESTEHITAQGRKEKALTLKETKMLLEDVCPNRVIIQMPNETRALAGTRSLQNVYRGIPQVGKGSKNCFISYAKQSYIQLKNQGPKKQDGEM